VLASHDAPSVPSIVSIFSGADWHERECFDFFGVIFEDHPNLKPLLLPDDLGVHPLLKENNRQSLYAVLPFDQLVDGNST
jgi:NADH-quinone oxidoreductase subunit C